MDLDAARVRNAGVIDWLARRAPKTAIAGICTGVTLLAAAGVLDGKPATTHWAIADYCRMKYPQVDWKPDRFVTESNNVFCGGGLYASIDLSLYLVEHYCGHMVAVQTAKALLLETPRAFQTTHDSSPPRSAHDDAPIQSAQKYLVGHFKEQIDLDALATKHGMSPRTFARRFKTATGDSPLTYLHRLRIDRARHMLESAHRSVEEISREIGYEDVAFFRHLFRRHTGASPREYRARFGPRAA
jgi:transcriptional regulator GlxA family with amidase domain